MRYPSNQVFQKQLGRMKVVLSMIGMMLFIFMALQAEAGPLLQDDTTFRDGFNDTGNDWELENGFDIHEGVLGLDITDIAVTHSLALPDGSEYEDFTAAIEIASEAEGFYTYHLWFRATSEGSGYAFSVTPSLGFYTVDLWQDGVLDRFLQGNTFDDAINRTGPNQIGLVVKGDKLRAYINGTRVQSITDETYTEGIIMLGATATDPELVPLVVSFDNLMVSSTADPALLDEPFVDEGSETPQIAEAPQNIIHNIPIAAGGIEIFPLPDRSSGRLHAATGTFEPHIAGKDASGEWVYIYYIDGGWQAGWSRASQLTIEAGDLAGLAVIDPQAPPELPELDFSETAVLPFGVAAPSASDDAAGDSSTGTSEDTPATTSRGGNHPPVIHSAQFTGSCENVTLIMNWSDEDGDAIRFEHRSSPGGGPVEGLTQSFSGGGSRHVVDFLYCEHEFCAGYLVIVDAAGNESRPVFVRIDC